MDGLPQAATDKPTDKPSASCEELLTNLESKIATDYPDQADEAQQHIDALRELLGSDSEEDMQDVQSMTDRGKVDPMSELMKS